MRIGIRGHDLGAMGVDGLIAGLRDADIKTLQLVVYKSIQDVAYAPNALSEEQAAAIGGGLKAGGAEIALLGAYFNPVHPEQKKVETGIAVFKDYLRLAKSLGASMVGSETGSFNGDQWTYHPDNRTPQARTRVAEVFRGLCDYGGQYGATVGIEGAAGHVCHDVAALREVIDSINRDNIRVIFDLFNFLDETNAGHYLEILDEGLSAFGSKIRCFHIKDFVVRDGIPVQVPVGTGGLDFRRALSMIKRHDPDATLILEGTTGGDIKPAVEFLREAWGSQR